MPLEKERFFSLLSLFLSIASFGLICWLIYRFFSLAPTNLDLYARQFMLGRWNLFPEPAERNCFLFGIFYLPLASIFCYIGLQKLDRCYPGCFQFTQNSSFLRARDLALFILFLGWLVIMVKSSTEPSFTGSLEVTYPFVSLVFILFFLILGLFLQRASVKLADNVYFVIAWLGMILFSLIQLIPESLFLTNYEILHPISVILGGINQVWLGKTMLVNCFSQYGILWPHMAELVFRLLPFTIFTVSLYFAALTFIVWLLFFLVIRNVTGSPRFASLSVLFMLGIYHTLNISAKPYAPYFQYLPLRVLPPALL